MSGSHRIRALEGLRGLAAAIVVVRHTTNAIPMPEETRRRLLEGPWAPLLDAQAAVALFFVLSGFVLAGSLARGNSFVDQLQFWVKRIFRIHPPYVAALLATWLASFAYAVPAAKFATGWLRLLAGIQLDAEGLLASLAYPGAAGGQLVVGWTLGIEMTWSLLLPVLFWLALRTHWALPLALAALPLAFGGVPLFALYGAHFALGLALFRERARVEAALSRLPVAATAALFVAALLSYSGPQLLGWHVPGLGILTTEVGHRASIALRLPGTALLIALALAVPWWRAALELRPMLFLGRISYSLYLLHMGVLILATRWIVPSNAGRSALLVVVVLGASIAVSAAFYRAVERPAIRLGNRVCKALAGRRGREALESAAPG